VRSALIALAIWSPAPTTEPWQLQLQGKVDLSVSAPVYDVDGADARASLVRAIHRRGARAICYFSAGSYENWRRDRRRFPKAVLGRKLEGWPGERWLDVRRRATLIPIMRARMRGCARKGFDAVDPDNVDGYANRTGFPLSARDQLRYNRALAREAHRLGLAIGLKNDLAQVPRLVRSFDFAINEQCFLYRECRRLRPFIRAGKAVFNVEYELERGAFCNTASDLRFSSIRKRLSLKRWRRPC
jgi:hypothetical protein